MPRQWVVMLVLLERNRVDTARATEFHSRDSGQAQVATRMPGGEPGRRALLLAWVPECPGKVWAPILID